MSWRRVCKKVSLVEVNTRRPGRVTKCVICTFAARLLVAVALGILAPRIPVRADPLQDQFTSPPGEASPWVFWHWMNGNITREGIEADLQAMRDAGIGGAMQYDIGLHPPGPVKVRSPEWLALVRFAVEQAAARGIKLGFHCPGWTVSGGPWITPALAMQELTWSETVIEGPRELAAMLAQPPTRLGYYRDAMLVAFPTPGGDEPLLEGLKPRFLDSGGKPVPAEEIANLFGGNLDRPASVPLEMDLVFDRPVVARSLSIRLANNPQVSSTALQAWNSDLRKFEPVGEVLLRTAGTGSSQIGAASFPAVCARRFRLSFSECSRNGRVRLEQLDLRGSFRITEWPIKAGFGCEIIRPEMNRGAAQPGDCIAPDTILDLTPKLGKDGRLNWSVPAGRWTLLRLGHTPTGIHVYPPPVGGDGLECDKLSRQATDFHYDQMMKPLLKEFGPELSRKVLAYYHADSYEAGWQNWTELFPAEFRARRGYDLLRFAPALTGRVVGDLATTERFLWDLRRTIADLYANNHYGRLAERCHADGFGFSTEAYGGPFEYLQCGGRADHPMVEFWLPSNPQEDRRIPFHGVFAGRTAGRRIIGAEAFTSGEGWNQHPFSLKAIGDFMYCSGVNQFDLHVFTHQPYTNEHLRPGLTCEANGTHFDRGNTWWGPGRAWIAYLARCQSLLQTGEHMADALYFQGNDAPDSVGPFEPPLPEGDDFDACGDEVLQGATVQDGRVTLPHGKSYSYLVLPAHGRITAASLRKIAGLIRDGASVVGPRVKESPSLGDYPACVAEFDQLNRELWGADETASSGTRTVARGRVIWGTSFEKIFEQDHLAPDFDFERSAGLILHHTHRRTNATDLYFVANASDGPGWVNCRFRVAGRVPELWHPDTGTMERCALHEEAEGITRVPIWFDRRGSVFVVFRERSPNGPGLIAVQKDGENALGKLYPETLAPPAPDQNRAVTNDFTIAFWARPAGEISLPAETTAGINWGNQNWAVYPPPGHDLYGEHHAGAGVSVGRNGVCVFEHWSANAPAVLVYTAPESLTDWTHVVVVFHNGTPQLYLNGRFVRSGLVSGQIVHSGVGVAIPPSHRASPFQGGIAQISQVVGALSGTEIAALAADRPELPRAETEAPALQFTADASGATRADVWKPGRYQFIWSDGQSRDLRIGALPGAIELTNAWKVHFPPGWGAPLEIPLPKLVSWSDHPASGVRYFSGTALYETEFDRMRLTVHV